MGLGHWGAQIAREGMGTDMNKELLDFGEQLLSDEAKSGKDVFLYTPNAPEKLRPRPLSKEERENAKASTLSSHYIPTVVKPIP